MLLILQTI